METPYRCVQPGRPTPAAGFDATVVISTSNRRDQLRDALRSSLDQAGCAVEVLLIDDATSDGTLEMVQGEFEEVTVYRTDEHRGNLVGRNTAARLARSPVLVAIDDDAAFTDPGTVAHVLREFDAPDIGMVAMPYLDFRGGRAPRERQHEGHGGERVVAIFTACAYAVRRDAFLGIGGYRESLRHYSEEADCAIRALDQGWFIRAGTSPPVHHRPEPRRSESFSRFQAIRNFVLTAWYDVPLPWVLLDILWWPLGFMVRASRYPPRNLGSMFRGLVSGFSALRLRDREPVSRGTSRAFHAMMREGGLPLERARALRG